MNYEYFHEEAYNTAEIILKITNATNGRWEVIAISPNPDRYGAPFYIFYKRNTDRTDIKIAIEKLIDRGMGAAAEALKHDFGIS